jgi:spermidine synthase
MKQGKYSETVANLYEVIRHNEATADTYYDMATAMSLQNKFDEAIKYFDKALSLDPNYPDARYKMGTTLMAAGRVDEAISELNQALQTSNNPAEIYTNLGAIYEQLGKYELASRNWNKAADLKPDNISVLNSMAWLLATVDNPSIQDANKAVELAQHACELTGYKDPSLLDTLAVAYAAAGRFDEAKATAEKALNIAKEAGRENLAGNIEKRIKLYEAGQPYRQK